MRQRFSLTTLYHSAAQPESLSAFSGGAIENAYAFSRTTLYHSAARMSSVRAFVGGATESAYAFSQTTLCHKIDAEEKNGGAAKRQEGPLARQPFFDESGKAGFIIP